MPLTQSPKLGLIRNDGSDAFRRQDFIDNWDTLDLNPGIFICTSTTRPGTWTAAQAGRLIFESDTRRLIAKTTTGWAQLNNYPTVPQVWLNPEQTLGPGANKLYDLNPVVTTTRPCTLILMGGIKLTQQAAKPQSIFYTPYVDGATAGFGYTARSVFADAGTGASGNAVLTQPILGVKAAPTPKSYRIQVNVTVGTVTGGDGVLINGMKFHVMFVE